MKTSITESFHLTRLDWVGFHRLIGKTSPEEHSRPLLSYQIYWVFPAENTGSKLIPDDSPHGAPGPRGSSPQSITASQTETERMWKS